MLGWGLGVLRRVTTSPPWKKRFLARLSLAWTASRTRSPAVPPILYAHPFSSYSQKVLIALYENDVPIASAV